MERQRMKKNNKNERRAGIDQGGVRRWRGGLFNRAFFKISSKNDTILRGMSRQATGNIGKRKGVSIEGFTFVAMHNFSLIWQLLKLFLSTSAGGADGKLNARVIGFIVVAVVLGFVAGALYVARRKAAIQSRETAPKDPILTALGL